MSKPPEELRRALVTGASAGLGQHFAEHLARDGYDLVLVARSRERLDRLAARLGERHGVQAEVIAADLTEVAELRRVEQRLAASPPIGLLINNAGFVTHGRFAALDADREEAEIRLNVLALVRLTRAALPRMLEQGWGRIINVSSLAGFQAGPYTATYAATKAYVTSFSESLAEELRGTSVGIQVLCPGFTRTELQQRAKLDLSEVPSFAWMDAESVVASSLKALQRGVVCHVPGTVNRLLARAVAVTPRLLVRRFMGGVMRRRYA